jgi:uncharacterized protein (DUF342 family)
MSNFDFGSLLSVEQKKNLLENRITQFAADAYQASLNSETIQKVNPESEELPKIEESLKLLEAAIKTHQKALSELPATE